MTAQEARLIQQLSEFVRDWRKEDTAWKADTDERLRAVEGYITAETAIETTLAETRTLKRLNRAQAFTAIGVIGSLVLSVWNAVVK